MKSTKLKLGAILYEGFELLDVFGPLEMFGMLPDEFEIVTLAPQAGSVASAQGPVSVAQYGVSDCDGVDLILLPGGRGTRKLVDDPDFLNALRRLSTGARYVTSVCTGAGVLAKAGLLDGRRATTNKLAWEWVTSQGPKVNWVPEARWVVDGKFTTAAGVSAGMDMSLGMIENIFDRERAEYVARQAEYEWHSDPDWDPFSRLAGLID